MEADDRIVNSEGQPYGPILAGILRDELESVRENAETSEAYRIAAILDMAAGYVEAVVEGKGPDATRIARLEAALRGLMHEDGALNGNPATDTPAEAAARAALAHDEGSKS